MAAKIETTASTTLDYGTMRSNRLRRVLSALLCTLLLLGIYPVQSLAEGSLSFLALDNSAFFANGSLIRGFVAKTSAALSSLVKERYGVVSFQRLLAGRKNGAKGQAELIGWADGDLLPKLVNEINSSKYSKGNDQGNDFKTVSYVMQRLLSVSPRGNLIVLFSDEAAEWFDVADLKARLEESDSTLCYVALTPDLDPAFEAVLLQETAEQAAPTEAVPAADAVTGGSRVRVIRWTKWDDEGACLLAGEIAGVTGTETYNPAGAPAEIGAPLDGWALSWSDPSVTGGLVSLRLQGKLKNVSVEKSEGAELAPTAGLPFYSVGDTLWLAFDRQAQGSYVIRTDDGDTTVISQARYERYAPLTIITDTDPGAPAASPDASFPSTFEKGDTVTLEAQIVGGDGATPPDPQVLSGWNAQIVIEDQLTQTRSETPLIPSPEGRLVWQSADLAASGGRHTATFELVRAQGGARIQSELIPFEVNNQPPQANAEALEAQQKNKALYFDDPTVAGDERLCVPDAKALFADPEGGELRLSAACEPADRYVVRMDDAGGVWIKPLDDPQTQAGAQAKPTDPEQVTVILTATDDEGASLSQPLTFLSKSSEQLLLSYQLSQTQAQGQSAKLVTVDLQVAFQTVTGGIPDQTAEGELLRRACQQMQAMVSLANESEGTVQDFPLAYAGLPGATWRGDLTYPNRAGSYQLTATATLPREGRDPLTWRTDQARDIVIDNQPPKLSAEGAAGIRRSGLVNNWFDKSVGSDYSFSLNMRNYLEVEATDVLSVTLYGSPQGLVIRAEPEPGHYAIAQGQPGETGTPVLWDVAVSPDLWLDVTLDRPIRYSFNLGVVDQDGDTLPIPLTVEVSIQDQNQLFLLYGAIGLATLLVLTALALFLMQRAKPAFSPALRLRIQIQGEPGFAPFSREVGMARWGKKQASLLNAIRGAGAPPVREELVRIAEQVSIAPTQDGCAFLTKDTTVVHPKDQGENARHKIRKKPGEQIVFSASAKSASKICIMLVCPRDSGKT